LFSQGQKICMWLYQKWHGNPWFPLSVTLLRCGDTVSSTKVLSCVSSNPQSRTIVHITNLVLQVRLQVPNRTAVRAHNCHLWQPINHNKLANALDLMRQRKPHCVTLQWNITYIFGMFKTKAVHGIVESTWGTGTCSFTQELLPLQNRIEPVSCTNKMECWIILVLLLVCNKSPHLFSVFRALFYELQHKVRFTHGKHS